LVKSACNTKQRRYISHVANIPIANVIASSIVVVDDIGDSIDKDIATKLFINPPQILRRQTSRSHYGSKVPVLTVTVFKYRNKIGKIFVK
jgi:hypothetical protein